MSDVVTAFDRLRRAAVNPPSREEAIDAALAEISVQINRLVRERDQLEKWLRFYTEGTDIDVDYMLRNFRGE